MFKYTEFNTSSNSSHQHVMSFVSPGSRVLEFGCAVGHMSQVLKNQFGCTVTGVEYSAEAGEQARPYLDRLLVGDAETLDYNTLLGAQRFDAILFSDVLEHLRDPQALVQRMGRFVAAQGAVVASIPNVAHGAVRLSLLAGEFRYRERGLLDSTHLRFFCKDSVQDLFEGAGFVVTHWRRVRIDIAQTELGVPSRPLPQGVIDWIAADAEATTYQFVVRAVPSEAAAQLHEARLREQSALDHVQFLERIQRVVANIASVVPVASTLVLIDAGQFGSVVHDRHVLPLLEHEGMYYGPPADGPAAIEELHRLQRLGASYVAVAWPAFAWLDLYTELAEQLRVHARCLLRNDSVILYALQ